MTLEIPLIKIDEERRLIVGRAAAECKDKHNEIMDYATAKPAFQKWSDEYSMLTNGLSKGNLRVMHQKTVAGKLVSLDYNDEEKAIDVVAKVVDDNTWNLVKSGCYTGFSIGGGYAAKWKDGELTRYTPDIRELSLVDNPCIPSARFAELLKSDGVVERLELHGVARSFGELWQSRPRSFAEQWAGRSLAKLEDSSLDQPDLVAAVRLALTQTFALYAQTHAAHWNVQGPGFAQFHAFFGDQYEEIHGAVDPLAEQLRQLDALAPSDLAGLSPVLGTTVPAATQPLELCGMLLDAHEALLTQLTQTFRLASQSGKQGLANFLADRCAAHSKHRWQLRATLGAPAA